jgi:hypothetical protein
VEFDPANLEGSLGKYRFSIYIPYGTVPGTLRATCKHRENKVYYTCDVRRIPTLLMRHDIEMLRNAGVRPASRAGMMSATETSDRIH